MDFATGHLKNYTSKFFLDLLKAENVAFISDVNDVHERLEKVEDAYKPFIAKVMLL